MNSGIVCWSGRFPPPPRFSIFFVLPARVQVSSVSLRWSFFREPSPPPARMVVSPTNLTHQHPEDVVSFFFLLLIFVCWLFNFCEQNIKHTTNHNIKNCFQGGLQRKNCFIALCFFPLVGWFSFSKRAKKNQMFLVSVAWTTTFYYHLARQIWWLSVVKTSLTLSCKLLNDMNHFNI